jgi:hypothetical protein
MPSLKDRRWDGEGITKRSCTISSEWAAKFASLNPTKNTTMKS